MAEIEKKTEIRYGGRFYEFIGMSSQSHLPHCRVLPPGEFNVMIPELRVTLQGAATWWIHCHDSRATCHIGGCCHVISEPRVTLQGRPTATWWIHCHGPRATCHIAGCSHLAKSMSWPCHTAGCNNSICHIENCFSPYFIFFVFLMQFGLWRALAFISSLIHLLHIYCWIC